MKCYLCCKGLILFVFQLFVVFSLVSAKLVPEKRILLEFKSSVFDLSGILSSWNTSKNPNHCSWFGVSCNSRSQVISINIPGGCGEVFNGNFTQACSCSSKLSKFPFYGFGLRRRACSNGKLVGKLSPLIGKLTELRVLSLAFNDIGGELPLGLWGLEKLEELDLEGNSFTGKLPNVFVGLRNLRVLNLGFNELEEEIPGSLSKCADLEVLSLAGNKLEGSMPGYFGSFNKLKGLYLSNNQLNGLILDDFGRNCRYLEHLDLSGNFLVGSIPGSLRNCRQLRTLLLFSNMLDGVIPNELGQLHELEILDLSGNKLRGPIPEGLHQLKHLKHLSLASNNLTGAIPSSFGQFHSLEVLELSSNSLSGEIPGGLVNLKNLTSLKLSKNKLSGEIPSGFSNMKSLSALNVSFNNLSGSLPLNVNAVNSTSVHRKPFLHSHYVFSLSVRIADMTKDTENSKIDVASPPGNTAVNKSLDSIEIASIASASAIVSVLLVLVALFFYTRKWIPTSRVQVSESREITAFVDIGVPLTYETIVQATGNFSAGKCIGNGGFGATYKAEISPATLVAVKRLAVGRFQGVQQFHAEIKTLETMRHPNLVTLIGYHASETEMFLIYNYLSGGNLENFIEERSERAVDWKIIHKIALDIAHALAYLHDRCTPKVLHRDVKPSNILLDDDCNAYLSDFGLSRLLGTSETHATTGVAGTFGYVAPEYAMTCRVSEKSDVYSYGVVLLELISDKKALDPSFSSHADGFNIVSWACMLLRRGQAKDVFTTRLWDTGPHDNLVDLLYLAITCTIDNLSTRPTMRQVVRSLKRIKPSSVR